MRVETSGSADADSPIANAEADVRYFAFLETNYSDVHGRNIPRARRNANICDSSARERRRKRRKGALVCSARILGGN